MDSIDQQLEFLLGSAPDFTPPPDPQNARRGIFERQFSEQDFINEDNRIQAELFGRLTIDDHINMEFPEQPKGLIESLFDGFNETGRNATRLATFALIGGGIFLAIRAIGFAENFTE